MHNKSFYWPTFIHEKIAIYFFWALIALSLPSYSQSNITLEDIWVKGTFRTQTAPEIRWAKDETYYYAETTSPKGASSIVKYNVITDKAQDTIFSADRISIPSFIMEEFSFSSYEDKILLTTGSEQIYRHSSRSDFYVFDTKSKDFFKINGTGKAANAEFSPDGSKVTFTRENNLFLFDLVSRKETAITSNGKANAIINGHTDWVYEEEFSFTKAYFWSPDSKKVAYYTFDESKVPTYSMQTWEGLYPKNYVYKYPKAGEKNASVSISVYNLEKNVSQQIPLGADTDFYVPRIKWTPNPDLLSIQKMNRLQNKLELIHADLTTGKSTVVLTETSNTYIDITDDLTYLPKGKGFVFSSEKDGYNHIYLHDMSGGILLQLTKGNWEVSQLNGIDFKKELVYFTSTEESPLQRDFFVVGLDGKNKRKLTQSKGHHQVILSPNAGFYIHTFSNANLPPTVELVKTTTNAVVKTLAQNKDLANKNNSLGLSKKEFFSFKTPKNDLLNGWVLKPQGFDPSKKYPVLIFVYGGPGHQTVLDRWDGRDFYWYHYLTQQGYMIVSVDGRGTGGRGAGFKKSTYANLGKYELEDQVQTANYLSSLSYIDSTRIGIWGWSFGGYLSSLCMTKAAGRFKMGIAVAPVTTWRFYDSIYTERFLLTPQDNAKGYDENSPLNYADRLKGNYLLIHGTGDDNVHFQHAVKMQEALIRAGKQFRSFYYPDKNHGIYGGNTRIHLYRMMTDYILEKL